MTFAFDWSYLPKLARGVPITLEVTAAAIAMGFVLGVFLALGRVYGKRLVCGICSLYIQIFRGTPLLVQLFIIYYGLPTIGIRFSALTCGILALGLNTAAYQAEYFRGAIQSVRGGQLLAARSLGMTLPQLIRHVVLPQAFRIVIPSWSNELILMLKYSSIVFTVTVLDLMGVGKRIASKHFNYFETFLVVALFYLVIVFIVSQSLRALERKVRIPGLGRGETLR